MKPCAFVSLYLVKWKIENDKRSILHGSAVGLLGAGGQLLLFQALREGPAYIIFLFISLYPRLTVLLSVMLLKEKTSSLRWIGIGSAILAIFFLSYQEPGASDVRGYLWMALSMMVFTAWGLQAFAMKFSNETMKAESIFFYMTIVALLPLMPDDSPLLRSKTIKNFMVGHELFASPQRDITAEHAAETIREQSGIHYTFH